MSIPTSFDPLGTLGGGELPYVQPVKTGFGMDEHSNEPSFGFSVAADSDGMYGTQKWYPFARDKQMSVFTNTHADVIIEFARPLRIDAIDFEVRRATDGYGMRTLNVYASGDGADWHFAGGMVTNQDVELSKYFYANHLALHTQGMYKYYKLDMPKEQMFFGIRNMAFTAFYKQ